MTPMVGPTGDEPLMVLGTDTGGTFTDLVLLDRRGGTTRLHLRKVPSRPFEPAEAIASGIDAIGGEAQGAVRIGAHHHGTTVGTNAVLEGALPPVLLLLNEGFEDLLTIGRQSRPHPYQAPIARPPLVPPSRVLQVRCRISAEGKALVALTPQELARIERQVGAAMGQPDRPQAVAICLLHATRDPHHEQVLADHLGARGWTVVPSHRVRALPREVERATTTVIDAALHPIMAHYIHALLQRSPTRSLSLMQSNGALAPAAVAAATPSSTLLSGPAAGLVGAQAFGRACGREELLTFDVGGTSTDVGIIMQGAPQRRDEVRLGGWDLSIDVLEIQSIGAGGGSVVALDEGGALGVGPRSVGAQPGPLCFGRQTHTVAMTDIDLLAGWLLDRPLGHGAVPLSVERARVGVRALAEAAGISLDSLLSGAQQVLHTTIAAAVLEVCTRSGNEPQEQTLFAYGGNGPVHACAVAEELGIATVFVPPMAGLFSALGMLLSPGRIRMTLGCLHPVGHPLHHEVQQLRAQLCQQIGGRGEGAVAILPPPEVSERFEVSMRYHGQSFSIELAVQQSVIADAGALAEAFHQEHLRRYGHAPAREHPSEVTALTLEWAWPAALAPQAVVDAITPPQQGEPLPAEHRMLVGGQWATVIPDTTEGLLTGRSPDVDGPALLTAPDHTLIVPPGWVARCGPLRSVVLSRQGKGRP